MTTLQCPYRGLRAFREEDAGAFFGREADSERLWRMVQVQRLVALVGPSGSGKSSVARAGLLPQARAAGWAVADFRPEADPFRSLAAGLLPLLEPEMTRVDRLAKTRKLAAAFRRAATEPGAHDARGVAAGRCRAGRPARRRFRARAGRPHPGRR